MVLFAQGNLCDPPDLRSAAKRNNHSLIFHLVLNSIRIRCISLHQDRHLASLYKSDHYIRLFQYVQFVAQFRRPAPLLKNKNFQKNGGLLLQLLRPWGTSLTTPFPPQKISLYGNGVFSIYVSLQKWIRSTLCYFHTTKAWSDNDFFLLCRSYISQNLVLPLSFFYSRL